jgi:GTP cyclohydrolase I
MSVGEELIRQGFEQMFLERGLDPSSDSLDGTPDRWLRAMDEFTSGYGQDPEKVLGRTFEVAHSDTSPIAVANIPFASVCEHHLLPFSGTAMIAYMPMPGGRVVGLSKLPRLLDVFARRFQTQEQITVQVTGALDTHLRPRGSACILKSEHGCMAHRGVRKPGAVMVTTSYTGYFSSSENRRELLATVGGASSVSW